MSYNVYHWCVVPECKSTSIKTPQKLWIQVPSDIKKRKTWLKLARRDPKSLSTKTKLYFCEDHFDLENDMENYIRYKIMGSVKRIQMKASCVPSRFDCQANRKHKSTPSKPRNAFIKRQRMSIIKEIEETIENKNNFTSPPSCSQEAANPLEMGDQEAANPLEMGDLEAANPLEMGDLEAANPLEMGDLEAANPLEMGDLEAANPLEMGDLEAANPLEMGDQEAANPLEMGDEVFCGCCLISNVILLESCKHVLFYETLFQNVQKMAHSLTYICITCHSIVKKLSEFHDMMMETQNLLYNKVTTIPYNRRIQKLQLTITEHLDIEPTEIAIKSEQISIDESSIKIESENTLESYEPKIENNENTLNNTDNIYQNDLSNIEESIDELVYSNQEIDNDNIDEDIPNLNDKTDGDSYSFDQYIDLDKPKQVTSKGNVFPYISRTLTGQRFTLPEIDSNEVKLVTVTLKDALAELHKKENSNQFKLMKFKCTKCFIGFNLENSYEAHMNKHNIKEDQLNHHLICDFCESLVLSQYAVTHYVNHFIRYQCIKCNKQYANFGGAKGHYKSAHDKSLRECDLCSFTTNSCKALRYHRAKKHTGVINECKICGKILSNPSTLKNHSITVHNTEHIELKPCLQCNKLLKPQSVSMHMKQVHGGDVNAYCVDCKQYFKTKNSLELHYKYHSNHFDSRMMTCDYCGQTFKRKQDVASHILRRHMPEIRKIKCNHCDRMFSRKCFATRHEKAAHSKNTESNERNHMCDYCGKRFKNAVILKCHVRIHTGERPYKCDICDATFAQSSSLNSHKRLKHLKRKDKKKLNDEYRSRATPLKKVEIKSRQFKEKI